jgi:hypothetical protein
VDFEQLTALMPDVRGWEKADVKGEQSDMGGFSISRAEADYNKGEVNVRLEITDTALFQGLLMPFAMLASGGFNERSSEGFKRGTTVAGHPGFEEWQEQTKNGDLNVLVGKRFIVHATGHDLPNLDVLKEVVQSVDVQKLAALK